MKHIISLFLFGIISLSSFGQIAHWRVKPSFDDAKILPNGLIETINGQKCGLYDSSGNELLPIEYDRISDFADNVALLYNDGKLCGIVNERGNVVDLSKSGFTPIPSQTFFSDNYLNVTKRRNGDNAPEFYYIDKMGKQVAGPFITGLPYSDGFALVHRYGNDKKPEDIYWAFIDTDQQEINIPNFDKKQSIQFLSSFRNGRAVCIYKNKGYYVTDSLTVHPINVDTLNTKKSQLAVDGKSFNIQKNKDNIVVTAKNAILTFNSLMQLDKIESDGKIIYEYESPAIEGKRINSELSQIGKAGEYGLSYKGNVLLPAQFTDVKLLDGKYALVKLNGKWGFITVDPNNQFQFKLNNNEHIGFNHRFYIAKLATLMPSYIKCNNTTVFSKSPDCEIQVESRNEIENIERNTLTYDCKLSIPESLSDTLASQVYTYALKYDGLQSIDYQISIPQWYVKYYEVELSNTKFTVNPNDTITVEFDLVKTDAARNDDTNYFKTVELITPENDNIPLNKITENHYSFRIDSGDRDRLSFIIKIKEDGCPSIEYPFEMVFTKPEPKSKNDHPNMTIDVIRKYGKANASPKPTPKHMPAPKPKESPIFIPK